MKVQKRVPLLLISVLSSMLLINLTAAVSAQGIYQEYNTDGISQPIVAVLMQGISHRVWPWESINPDQIQPAQIMTVNINPFQPSKESSGHAFGSSPDTGSSSPEGSPEGKLPDDGSVIHPTADMPEEDSAPIPDSGIADTETQPSEPVQYEFTEVTQEYFDDALFIGDSRAVGIQLYSGWDNLTYCAESGMTIYNMFDRQITREDGTKTTLEEALTQGFFGKIYLEIGINEMGTGTVDSFMTAYENALLHLQELQPDADIFLCGIMYVRKSKSDSDPIFNNPGIRERNERIAGLADQITVFYLDINEVTSDESGNLNPEYTWDEVHLLGKYNVLWTDYLCKHGIVKENPEPKVPGSE